MLCDLGGGRGRGPRRPNPRMVTLAMGTWNVTLLGGEEPELVREVERYQLEIVGLTSMHSLGSGTQLLERCCQAEEGVLLSLVGSGDS